MDSPMESYLGELSRDLTKRLGRGEAKDRLAEIESHLCEKSDAYRELGFSKEGAEMEAILRFGMPWEVARAYTPRSRTPWWLGEALMILGAITMFLFEPIVDSVAVFGFMLMLNASALCRRFPGVGLVVAVLQGFWIVVSSPPHMRYPPSYQSMIVPIIVWIVGAYVAGHLARWGWPRLKRMRLSVRWEDA